MQFFKHFSDAHRGTSVQAMMKKFGHAGYSVYFILVEMCAEKMTKNSDEEYTEAHCNFRFDERILRDSLRLSAANVARYLHLYGILGLLSSARVENEYHIAMPKLLEYLDRDLARARPRRAKAAPRPRLDIDIEEEKDIEGERGAAAEISSLETLRAAIPAPVYASMVESYREYGGALFVQGAIENAFRYYCEKSTGWKVCDWISKINAALEYAKKTAPQPFRPTPTPQRRKLPELVPAEIPEFTEEETAAARQKLAALSTRLNIP